ncbi:MAG: sulfatase-like hydrolase/transferase, partial [Opitutales bacterium]
FVMEADHAVERVQNALRNNGFEENTLVLFSSDHGAASYAGNIRKATVNQIKLLEKKGHYSSGPYRGYKFSVYEGGLRVPLIAKWPGVSPAGTTCDRLVGLNDLFATLAEAAGHKLPRGAAPDSVSFLSLLKKPGGKATRTTLVMQSTGPMVIRENNWKLCLCPGSGSNGPFAAETKSEPAWKKALAAYGKKPRNHDELLRPPFVQLYDLAADPGERNNLAAGNPETVQRLIGLLKEQIASGRSTPGPKRKNGRDKIHAMQRVPQFVWKK